RAGEQRRDGELLGVDVRVDRLRVDLEDGGHRHAQNGQGDDHFEQSKTKTPSPPRGERAGVRCRGTHDRGTSNSSLAILTLPVSDETLSVHALDPCLTTSWARSVKPWGKKYMYAVPDLIASRWCLVQMVMRTAAGRVRSAISSEVNASNLAASSTRAFSRASSSCID